MYQQSQDEYEKMLLNAVCAFVSHLFSYTFIYLNKK